MRRVHKHTAVTMENYILSESWLEASGAKSYKVIKNKKKAVQYWFPQRGISVKCSWFVPAAFPVRVINTDAVSSQAVGEIIKALLLSLWHGSSSNDIKSCLFDNYNDINVVNYRYAIECISLFLKMDGWLLEEETLWAYPSRQTSLTFWGLSHHDKPDLLFWRKTKRIFGNNGNNPLMLVRLISLFPDCQDQFNTAAATGLWIHSSHCLVQFNHLSLFAKIIIW